jgi:hypothetical protein
MGKKTLRKASNLQQLSPTYGREVCPAHGMAFALRYLTYKALAVIARALLDSVNRFTYFFLSSTSYPVLHK